MKPNMERNKPSTACRVKCPSSRSAKNKKPTLNSGVRKCKTKPQPPATHSLTRRSTRGDAGIRGHELIGKYRTEITSSQGKRCGVFALEISTSKQLCGLTTLTPKVWDRLLRSDASRAWHEKQGWIGRDFEQEFYDEQLALVLYLWGREHGRTLRLGVATDGLDPFVLPLPALPEEEAPEAKMKEEDGGVWETVWVHNDNAKVIMGRLCNHYSGITVLEPFCT